MRAKHAILCLLCSLLQLWLTGCAGGQGGSAPAVASAPRGSARQESFARYVCAAVRGMPAGGGYAADRAAEVRLAEQGCTWRGGRLGISPAGASPTFCSAACYMVLLQALRSWEQEHAALSPAVWYSLRVEPLHPDGFLSWGRINANGPGLAKWAHDTGIGCNFTSFQAARAGDFLKFFHSPAIGAHERGHLVVFLGMETRAGRPCIRYWSGNRAGGYGVRTVPVAAVHHPIFTRITHPERIAGVLRLPAHDEWLASMLSRHVSYAEVCAKCGVRPTPPQ